MLCTTNTETPIPHEAFFCILCRFTFVQYEDLSLDIVNKSKNLLDFFGLPLSEAIRKTIMTGTKDYLNTSRHTFSWRKQLIYSNMVKIQEKCGRVLDLLGYRWFSSPEQYRNMSLSPFNSGHTLPWQRQHFMGSL